MGDLSLENMLLIYTETIERFYSALKTTPRISGQVNNKEGRLVSYDDISIIFEDGGEAILKCNGMVYDFTVLSPEKHDGKQTIEQVKEIIGQKGKNPVRVRYNGVNEFSGSKGWEHYGPLKGCHGDIVIEIPWKHAKEIIGIE